MATATHIEFPNAYLACPEQNTVEWEEARQILVEKHGMTASEAPCLVKRGYDSMQKLIRQRLGIEDKAPPDLFKQQLFERGHDLEPFALDLLGRNLNLDIHATGFWLSTLYPYMGASPDGIGVDANGNKFVVECKAPLSTAIDQRKFGRYCVQAYWQMMVMDVGLAYIVVYHPTETPLMWHLRRDAILEDILIREYGNFRTCLQTRNHPKKTREIQDYVEWETRMWKKFGHGTSFTQLQRPHNMSYAYGSNASKFVPNRMKKEAPADPTTLIGTPCKQCSSLLVQNTTQKDGPNFGKRYVGCPNRCKGVFFEIDKFAKNDFAEARTNGLKRTFTDARHDEIAEVKAETSFGLDARLTALEAKIDVILSLLQPAVHIKNEPTD